MALLRSLKVSIFTIRVFYLKEKKKKKTINMQAKLNH